MTKNIPINQTEGESRKMASQSAQTPLHGKSKNSLLERFFAIPRIGMLLALMSSMTFATCGAIAKSVVKNVGALEVVAIRYCTVGIIMTVPILNNVSSLQISGKKWFFGCLGGLIAGMATIFGYLSYSYIPLMDAQTLFNFQSVFVAVIAFIVLKEQIGVIDVISITVASVGVVLVCRPSFIFDSSSSALITHSDQVIGSGFALLCAFSLACAGVITRYLKDMKPYLFTYFISCGGIVCCLLAMPILGNMPIPSLSDAIMMFSTGILGCMSKIFLTLAFQMEDSLPVSLTQSMEIVWSFFLQWIVFRDLPSSLESFGAILVFLGVCIMTAKKFLSEKLCGSVKNGSECDDEVTEETSH